MSRIYVDRIYRIYVLHYVIYVIYGGIYDNLYFTKNIYVHIYVYIYGTCMTYIDIHVPNMSLICIIYVCSVWERLYRCKQCPKKTESSATSSRDSSSIHQDLVLASIEDLVLDVELHLRHQGRGPRRENEALIYDGRGTRCR